MFQAVSSIPMDCWSSAMRSSIQSRRCSSPSPQSRHWRTHRLIRWYDPTASSSTMRFRGVGMAVLPLSKPRRRGYRRIRGNLAQAAETQVGGCPRLSSSPLRRRKFRSVGVPDFPLPRLSSIPIESPRHACPRQRGGLRRSLALDRGRKAARWPSPAASRRRRFLHSHRPRR